MLKYLRSSVGQVLSEYGIALATCGLKLEEKAYHIQHHTRHRTLFPLNGYAPQIAPGARIALSATLISNVQVGEGVVIGAGSVLKGQPLPIRISAKSIVGDMTTIEARESEEKLPGSANIGADVFIGDKCRVGSCVIDECVTVGSGTVIGEGAVLERGVTVLPFSLVPSGAILRADTVYAGSPIKVVGSVTAEVRAESQQLRSQVRALAAAVGSSEYLLRLV